MQTTNPQNLEALRTVGDLMALWPSDADFARGSKIKPSHAQVMKLRGSIPVDYWPSVIAAAKESNIEGVNAELLMRLHSEERLGAGS